MTHGLLIASYILVVSRIKWKRNGIDETWTWTNDWKSDIFWMIIYNKVTCRLIFCITGGSLNGVYFPFEKPPHIYCFIINSNSECFLLRLRDCTALWDNCLRWDFSMLTLILEIWLLQMMDLWPISTSEWWEIFHDTIVLASFKWYEPSILLVGLNFKLVI